MNNHPLIDRGILVPIGIGILSMAGIGLLFLIVYFDKPQAASASDPTATPFKFLLLATETRTPDPASEIGEGAGAPTEGTPSLDQPTLSATELTTTQIGTDDTTGAAPGETSAPTTDPSILYAGQYDDIDERIVYDGDWLNEIVSGAYNETLFTSLTIGDTAAFTFVGEQIQLGYLEGPELGAAIIAIDEVEYPLDQSIDSEWLSPELPYGEHSVLITHASGDFIILDYITILASP